jgi:hypothetical protein
MWHQERMAEVVDPHHWWRAALAGTPIHTQDEHAVAWWQRVHDGSDEEERKQAGAAMRQVHHRRYWQHVIDAARAQAQQPIRVLDGSDMPAREAMRALAHREVEDAYEPLRASIDHTHQPHHRACWQAWHELRTHHPHDASALSATLSSSKAFLAGTADAAQAAWDVLLRLGKSRTRSSAAAARALDLTDAPVGSLFSAKLIGTIVTQLHSVQVRGAAVPFVRGVRAPPALTGVVIDIHIDSATNAPEPSWLLCADEFRLGGAMHSLFGVALGMGRMWPQLAWPARMHMAAAGALALTLPAFARSIELSSSQAQWLARASSAHGLLHARMQAALLQVLAVDNQDWDDALHSAMRDACTSAAPGDVPLLPLWRLSLPVPMVDASPAETWMVRAHSHMQAAAALSSWQDQLDDNPWLHRSLVELVPATYDDAAAIRGWNECVARVV